VSTPAARHVVAVGSGKGGVGKSTVTLNLAYALGRRGWKVGLLDADLYGPDIPLMLNLKRDQEARRWDFWRGGDVRLEPVERDGLQVMSVGFLLAERQSLTFAAPLLGAALRQLVEQVEWRSLDVLLIDLPPGTADLQQQLLGVVVLAGAVVVVGPQDVAHLDARKFVDFLRGADVPVLGGVENMAGLRCPHCGEQIDVFPPAAAERAIWSDGVRLLGRIPLDPDLTRHEHEFDGVAELLAEQLDAA
jgi:ATP-binding protein involved in chromosome partitioning